jgi:hypothetical protein
MELRGKRARFSGPDLWFRSSVKIGYPVGSLCFLFRRVTFFLLFRPLLFRNLRHRFEQMQGFHSRWDQPETDYSFSTHS